MNFSATAVSVRFGSHLAVDQVSLRLVPGQVACVVGGDGAGKTTLLRVLCGAIRPDAGKVDLPERAQIGYLPAGSGIYEDLSVEENLAFAAEVYGIGRVDARRRVDTLLDLTGLGDARRRLGRQLSGGMRQKVGVVRAMLHEPRFLVLDEPTTGVDPVSRADLWRLLTRAAAGGAAVVLATTYIDEAERASTVLLLDAGRGIASGTPTGIVENVEGTIHAFSVRPEHDEALTWRRGAGWRTWSPSGDVGSTTGELVAPDLSDAVVVASLRTERAALCGAAGTSR